MVDDLAGLRSVDRERLLTEDVEAGVGRPLRPAGVQGVRERHVDRVDVGPREEVVVPPVSAVDAELVREGPRPVAVARGDGRDPVVRSFDGREDRLPGDARRTEDAEIHDPAFADRPLIGRVRPRGGPRPRVKSASVVAAGTTMSVSDHVRRVRSIVDTEGHTAAADEHSRAEHVADAALRGLQAGFVATLVMTAFRLPIMRSLPPSANFWAQYVTGGEPSEHPIAGLVLHLAYGVQAGVVFGVLFALQDAERSIEPEQRGLLWGSVYGLALSAFGSQIVLEKLLGIRLEADELALFHAGHLVYGLALGAWVGSRTEGVADPQEEYEYDDGN